MKIGILGAGQLGRMLALAGIPHGHEFLLVDPNPQACGAGLGEFFNHSLEEHDWIKTFTEKVDVVTLEWENIPVSVLEEITRHVPVYPSARAVGVAQDRLFEKRLFRDLDIPTPTFHAIDSPEDIKKAFADSDGKLVLKTRRFGYDGKGQQIIHNSDEAQAAWSNLGEVPLISESFMPFQRECSVIAARSKNGECRFYPLSQNEHRDGILYKSQALKSDPLTTTAQEYCHRLLDALDYVGVLALELFDCDGQLVANEIAPRVHNSGHWTIEGAVTSQFENHIRAISDSPLGDTGMRGDSTMINLVGTMPDAMSVLSLPGAHLHDYGKKPRPGRKIGHVTVSGVKTEQMQSTLQTLVDLVEAQNID
ncbi:5-(carboxyamino)imidazole ribonucleotide synthase [Kaarinaea lacus]